MRAAVRVSGMVQGVGFRPFVYRIAKRHGLAGYVKNLGDAGVLIEVEGDEEDIDTFLHDLETKNPAISRLDSVETSFLPESGFSDFSIIASSHDKSKSVSSSPPDIAVCEDCMRELFESGDRRNLYPFINCTHCGPRFSIVESLPYDRPNTTMREFPMCEYCASQYGNPDNRRYHAQPVCCPLCGPQYTLEKKGKIADGTDAIRKAAGLLDSGKIIAIKGLGGFHIACNASDDASVGRLRNLLGRDQQPFAVMARNIAVVHEITEMDGKEEAILSSYRRPIVVLRDRGKLSPFVAPRLNTVGVMLPYLPLHYLLFRFSTCDVFVMTSGNFPGNPMATELEKAKNELPFADYFLTHNLAIQNRIDDSVIKFVAGSPLFVRRSRGYVPDHIPCPHTKTVLAFGAELLNTFCMTKGGKAFLSQHIGNTQNFEVLEFQKDAITHFQRLLSMNKFDHVMCDLHPQYNTTRLASRLSRVWQVQHHFAHVFSFREEKIIVIAADGAGYGTDSHIWGGEVLYAGEEFLRLGHLEEHPLVGDVSSIFPARFAFSILDLPHEYVKYLRHGDEEHAVLQRQLEKGLNMTMTSSCGRILDAASVILEISHERTYEGEPAMKLEATACGKPIHLPAEICEEEGVHECIPFVEFGESAKTKMGKVKIIMTKPMLETILDKYMSGVSRNILATSILETLGRAFSTVAIENARELDVKKIGFSGGCAYNTIMAQTIKSEVGRAGLEFLLPDVPCGDGGISYGQACAARYLGENDG